MRISRAKAAEITDKAKRILARHGYAAIDGEATVSRRRRNGAETLTVTAPIEYDGEVVSAEVAITGDRYAIARVRRQGCMTSRTHDLTGRNAGRVSDIDGAP